MHRTTVTLSSTIIVGITVNDLSRPPERKDASTKLPTRGWGRSSACVGRRPALIALRWSEPRSWMGVSSRPKSF